MNTLNRLLASLKTGFLCGLNYWRMTKNVDLRKTKVDITFSWSDK